MLFFLLVISILDVIIIIDDNNVNIELCCYIREDLVCEFISFCDNLLILMRVFCLLFRFGC